MQMEREECWGNKIEMTYKERENRLILEMENRTAYDEGLTIPELCKRVLDYEIQVYYDRDVRKAISGYWRLWSEGRYKEAEKTYDAVMTKEVEEKYREDEKRAKQLKRMLKRTCEKYRCGTRHNDTTIERHQYVLIPPKLQSNDRKWRCIHVVPGLNGHLLEPLIMRSEQALVGCDQRMRSLERAAKRSKEEDKKMLDMIEEKILQGRLKKEKEKKQAEAKEFPKAKPTEFDTKLDSY